MIRLRDSKTKMRTYFLIQSPKATLNEGTKGFVHMPIGKMMTKVSHYACVDVMMVIGTFVGLTIAANPLDTRA